MTDAIRRQKRNDNVLSLAAVAAQDDLGLLLAKYRENLQAGDAYEAGRLSLAIEQATCRSSAAQASPPQIAAELASFRLLDDVMRLSPDRRADLMRALRLIGEGEAQT